MPSSMPTSRTLLSLAVLQCSASLLSVEAAPSLRAQALRTENTLPRELQTEYVSKQNSQYGNGDGDMTDEMAELPVTNEEEEMENMLAQEEVKISPSSSEDSEEIVVATSEPTITMKKTKFLPYEEIEVSFTSGGVDASNWRIGLYLHDADPQDGSLPPIVSMPACPSETKCTEGTVVFHDPNKMEFDPFDDLADWPLNSGLAYDAQLLNEKGWQMSYSVPMFSFIREDEEDY